ncbi:hypothetical protein PV416_09955 [Streptomyces ipomoeae]|uniref:hypothetical protein n=1 Tax=Streptomyces ipomoeae TaxID=103232 RepID=UPI001319C3A9|nr:hypothetical protein [Streptomyces ipomoeae]MDX2693720.1 hypothetical protein [Streptomyces ipomoeae]MDX2821404.1 hypothetical protein [Streptomyces ipomoeae]MDX2839613.1 hypothetical protein [Streptomyces ipomoeae]MDX2874138.1 hypothetical protein [Streptomyces ipomoeae]
MLDEVAIAVATGAAGNVAAYLLQGQVDALRTRLSAIFRHGTEQQQSNALRTLDEDAAALAQQTTAPTDITSRWTGHLTAFLAAYPEAREDVEALASAAPSTKTVNIGSQHNHGSGTFIGGDNHGGITITPGNS